MWNRAVHQIAELGEKVRSADAGQRVQHVVVGGLDDGIGWSSSGRAAQSARGVTALQGDWYNYPEPAYDARTGQLYAIRGRNLIKISLHG
jgi:hypothetical protein